MRALVTGSAGFVGRHMVAPLMEAGYDVDLVDVAQGNDCREWFANNYNERFDLVVHCAAVVGGRATIDGRPLHLACEDLSIDAALFGWAMRARPKRIVYFSSAAAYPIEWQRPVDGETENLWFGLPVGKRPLLSEDRCSGVGGFGAPDNTYGLVKVVGERLAAEANTIGIPTHVFRPFSGYGGDQDQAYPFPAIIARALRHESPFPIWGDGASSRDWVHIDDVVGAVLAAIDADVLGPVNICTGVETSFDQLATLAMVAAGYHAPITHDMSAPQGVFRRIGDPTMLHEFYTPKVSIEEGVVRAINRHRAPMLINGPVPAGGTS